MPAEYDKFGARFQYPENWTIAEEDTDGWPKSLTLQSPKTGFWSVTAYDSPVDPGELLDEALNTMRQEYDNIESTAFTAAIGEIETTGYDLEFYCLDFVVRAGLRVFERHGRTWLVLFQGEDREFQQIDLVFQAITFSLVQNLTAP